MKSKSKLLLQALLMIMIVLLVGCSSPIDESVVEGDYGSFHLDSDGDAWLGNDGDKYITIYWKVTNPDEHQVKISYEITDDNVAFYQEDNWDELGWYEISEDEIWENFDYLAETYNIPPEGEYTYVRSEEKLVYEDGSLEYYKKD